MPAFASYLRLPQRVGSFPAIPATMVRGLAWLVTAVVVGWVMSSWFWQIVVPDTAPKPDASALLDHQAAAKVVASRHLFGLASSGGDESGAAHGGLNFRLLGAMTASPEAAGFAILVEDGKPALAVVEGETFMPGVTLEQVLPGQVRLKIGERVETIEMTIPSIPQLLPGKAEPIAQEVPGIDRGVPVRPEPNPRLEHSRP